MSDYIDIPVHLIKVPNMKKKHTQARTVHVNKNTIQYIIECDNCFIIEFGTSQMIVGSEFLDLLGQEEKIEPMSVTKVKKPKVIS